MRPVTTRSSEPQTAPVLYMALELGSKDWKVGFSTGLGQRPRICTVPAGALERLHSEICRAKARFGLPADAAVRSAYEAGRDGFWIHRALCEAGIDNQVLDSCSILVDRRARRAKSDGLDVRALLELLIRFHAGDRRACRTVRVPSREAEDARQMQRELRELKGERTALTNRIKGLLATQGTRLAGRGVQRGRVDVEVLVDGQGAPLPEGLRARIGRELERLRMLDAQITQVEKARKVKLEVPRQDAAAKVAWKLMQLRAIGNETAWVCSVEAFAWRTFRNTGQVGASMGLAPTPYQSGTSQHEQGISKAGNRHVRALAIEAAWAWVRYQPQSALTRWFHRRFGDAGPGARKKGIVAMARKLMIALWKYVQHDELPEGALLKT